MIPTDGTTEMKESMTTFSVCVAIHRRTGNLVGYFNAITEDGEYRTGMFHRSFPSAVGDAVFHENVLSRHFIEECDILKVYEYDEYER